MGIVLGSNFDVQTALALDSRLHQADLTARDAINPLVRYEGMIVYVVAEAKAYYLKGGIDNADWEEVGSGSGGGGAAPVLIITADYVMDGSVNTVMVNCTSGDIDVTLPPSTGDGTQLYRIKKYDPFAGVTNILPDGTDVIEGETLLTLNYQYDFYTLCDALPGGWIKC